MDGLPQQRVASKEIDLREGSPGTMQPEKDGQGKTGETYLAGPDRLMRSVSRQLLTYPKQYLSKVVANGTPEAVAKRHVESALSATLP